MCPYPSNSSAELHCIHNALYSAKDILYTQRNLIGCSQATLVRSRDLGLG